MTAIAIKPTSTWSDWRNQPPSDTNASSPQVTEAVVPDLEAARPLLERLVRRSTSESGLDREALLRLNRDAWGVE